MISRNSSAFKTPKVQVESSAKISFQSNSKSCDSSHTGRKTSAINTPPTSNKPPTGIHPYSQSTFQSSGFWIPNLSTTKNENKVKNVKHRFHSPTRTSSVQSAPTTSRPIQSSTVSEKLLEKRWIDDVNCQCRFNNGNCCHEDLRQTTIVSERVSSRIQKLISEVTSSDVTTHKLQHVQRGEMKTMTNEASTNHGANKLTNSYNFLQSASTQPGQHLRQTSADAASNYVSPFHKLNYCLKTNLNQTKVHITERPSNQQLEASKVLVKSDEAAEKDNLKSINDTSPLRPRDDEAGDLSEKRDNREEKSENVDESRKTKEEVLLSSIELPQIKTRTGSLTETSKESILEAEFEGGRNRMRGLSLSASCLPFKPFQLQKPNLPWNRVSSVSTCTSGSVDGKCQENFKNYVRVNIRPEQSIAVNHAKKRIESFLTQSEVRHSLPSLWKTGVFPSQKKEDNSCEDFSTSAESLHSVSTKCSIPSIQISTFDSNEDVHGSVASPFLGSPSPLCDSSSSECIRTPTPINKEDEEISQLPSSSSPPPPVPPRNRSLYHNLRGDNKITSTNPEIQFGGGIGPSCAEVVNLSDQGVYDPTAGSGTTDRLSPQMFYDFRSRESQDYVMATMKHEKSHIIGNQDSRRSYQSSVVTPRSKNSEILHDNARDQRVQKHVESNLKEIREIPINPVKVSDPLHSEAKPAKRLPENLHLSPKSASLAIESSPLPSPDEKLKNFVIPCLWFNSTPYDRLLISILDPRNTISDLDKLTSWEGYKRLLEPIGPDEWSPTSVSPTPSPTTSADNSGGQFAKSSPLSQSPVSPFFRSKFSAFIAEEENAEGGQVDEASNNTILNSVQTIVSNYQELESRIKKLLTTTTDAKTQGRFSLLLQQMDTSLQLIAKLTDQMTKLSSDTTLKGHARQNRLIEKLAEARDLKMNIDKKGEQLALKMKKSIDQKSFEMLEFLLKARTYVTLLNRSNFINARRKASIPNIVIN